MRVLRGVVYMTKSSGPRTEPWGTPQEDVYQEDRSVSHFTRKQRDDRYDVNQQRTEPWIPNQDERRVIKMSWSIVYQKQQRCRVNIGMLLSVILLHWRGDHWCTKELFRWSDVCNRLTGENLVNRWKCSDRWDGIWRHVLLFWKWETDSRLADSSKVLLYPVSVF